MKIFFSSDVERLELLSRLRTCQQKQLLEIGTSGTPGRNGDTDSSLTCKDLFFGRLCFALFSCPEAPGASGVVRFEFGCFSATRGNVHKTTTTLVSCRELWSLKVDLTIKLF